MSAAPRTNTRQVCARCFKVDRVGFLAPKDLWRLVAGSRWEHDILCLVCFGEIGDEKGIKWDVPELEFYPVSYVTLAARRESLAVKVEVLCPSCGGSGKEWPGEVVERLRKVVEGSSEDDWPIAVLDALAALAEEEK